MRSQMASSSSGNPLSGLGRQAQDLVGGHAEHPFDLGGVTVGIGGGQVDLVEGGHDLLVVLEGLIGVGERLGLDALGGVDEQHHPLAGGQAAADLVAEVHVAGGVDEVDGVAVPVHPDVLGLDGDAPLPLDVHGVEVLLPHVAGVDGAGQFEDPVRERRLAVVDVGHDAQVPDAVEVATRSLLGKEGEHAGGAPASHKCGASRRPVAPPVSAVPPQGLDQCPRSQRVYAPAGHGVSHVRHRWQRHRAPGRRRCRLGPDPFVGPAHHRQPDMSEDAARRRADPGLGRVRVRGGPIGGGSERGRADATPAGRFLSYFARAASVGAVMTPDAVLDDDDTIRKRTEEGLRDLAAGAPAVLLGRAGAVVLAVPAPRLPRAPRRPGRAPGGLGGRPTRT